MSPTISIITATYNAGEELPGLIDSLRSQTNADFEWIIVDGASVDNTAGIVSQAGDVVTKWESEPDCGIYHALNKALETAVGEYYLVLGADDRLAPDAIENYVKAVEASRADVIAARMVIQGRVASKRRGPPWLYGQFSYVAGHAVGTLFRRSLHERFGYYSLRFQLAADMLFIKTIFRGGASCCDVDFVAGEYGRGGVTSVDLARSLSESFRVQLETEAKAPQVLLYILRLIKHFKRL